jgi:hypothetical protein
MRPAGPSERRQPENFSKSDRFEWWVGQRLRGQAVLNGGLGHRDRDGGRGRPQVGNWWQQGRACAGRVGEFVNGVRGRGDHGVVDSPGTDDRHTEAESGEDQCVVGLGDGVGASTP